MRNLIETYWIFGSIASLILSCFGNRYYLRYVCVVIFLVFGVVAGLRGVNFNSDTENYALHFETNYDTGISSLFVNAFTSWFEPGYLAIVYFFSGAISVNQFILIVSVFPTAVFAWQFIAYRYHPAIITHIFSTMMLVGLTTTSRHTIALAMCFVVANAYVHKREFTLLSFSLPLLFHYSTLALSLSILADRVIQQGLTKVNLLLQLLCLLLACYALYEFGVIDNLYMKFHDRISQETQATGLRNAILLFLVLLTTYSRGCFLVSRISLLHFVSVLLAIAIIATGWLGINRVISFFIIAILVYLNYYNTKNFKHSYYKMCALNLISLLSVITLANHLG